MSLSDPPLETGLTLTLFGPMQVQVQGRPLPPLRSRKALWLLALLTLRHDRPVAREWLAGTLWPNVTQTQAFANLRPVLSGLREAMGSEGERVQSRNRHSLFFDLTGASVDLITFDSAMASGNPAALAQAIGLYRGPLLEGCTEEWVGRERDIREQQCLKALQTLAETALATQDYTSAADHWRRAVQFSPFWEVAQRGLMEALAKTGNTNSALEVYREFVALLKADPKANPDEETRALYQRLRTETRQPPTVPVVAAPRASDPPEVSGYIPHPMTELIGREDESTEVQVCLHRSRLVSLTGPGGIGKTRLAIEVAGQLVKEYSDGVWLVALDSIADPMRVPQSIAQVLGAKEAPGRPLMETLVDFLRDKHLVLVLDNCEHLLKTIPQIVGQLLRDCARIRILATSREALGITGEVVWAVPALAVPDPEHLPTGTATIQRVVLGYESVQLFVERAQAAQKTFTLSGNSALAVARICQQVEGIPLAIEFAAARVRAMTVEQIAERLHDHHLSLLTGGGHTTQSRQQTLRSTLDWSYDLLSEPERLLLRRLSIFAGGWDLEAAEQVCSGDGIEPDQILDLSTSLLDKSLVVFETEGRYRLLEMVRQYAAEKLCESGETERFQERHRDHFLKLAEQGADQADAFRLRFSTEHDNLRAALDWCTTEEHGAELGLRLAGALGTFWHRHGYYSEGRQYLGQALERPGAQARTAVRAQAALVVGILAFFQGDYVYAQQSLEESLSISREGGDKRVMAIALNNLGNIAHAQGNYATVRMRYEEGLSIFRELGDLPRIAWSLDGLGNAARSQGDYVRAQALHEESLSIQRQLDNKRGIVGSLLSLGTALQQQGNYPAIQPLYEESLRLSRELNDPHCIAFSLRSLSNVIRSQKDYAYTQTLLEESLRLFQQMGDRDNIAWTVRSLGIARHADGDPAAAQSFFEEGLQIFRELGDKNGIAWSLNSLGGIAYTQDDYGLAGSLYRESLRLFVELGDQGGAMECLYGLASLLTSPSETRNAVRLWAAAERMCETLSTSSFANASHWTPYGEDLEELRSSLSEEDFTAAWEEGRALTSEQAIAYAMKER